MKYKSKLSLVLFSMVLLIGIMLPVLTACDPTYEIEIENGAEQVVTIYYDFGRRGHPRSVVDVEPDELINTIDFWIADSYCQIDAENEEGELIFSKEYFWTELRDMDWTVVITPPE